MYRQLRNQGGIMDVMPRQQYGFGDVVKKITGGVKKAAGAVGDFLGSAVNKVDLADIGSIAALASGNPQLAASFQTMGGGTGNKYLDAGLQLYSGFNQGYNSPQSGGAFGIPKGGIQDLSQYLMFNQPTGQGDYDIYGEKVEERGIGGGTDWTEILRGIGSVGTQVMEGILGKDLEKAGATAAGGTAAYLSYKDQQRINEQMQKAYEQFKAGEAKKYEQYRTGEGLPSLTVTGRERTKEDVVALSLIHISEPTRPY